MTFLSETIPKCVNRTIAGVVAHHHVTIGCVCIDGLFIREQRREGRIQIIHICNPSVHMAGKLAFARRLVRVKTINILKMRRRGVEAHAIDAQMPVVTDLHLFAGVTPPSA